jgi:hypothetical protein
MIKNTVIIFLSICFFTIGSCTKSKTTAEENLIVLGNCSTTNEDLPTVCYDSLITDSRCPSDVICVWAGVAIVKLSMSTSSGIQRFSLSTSPSPNNSQFPSSDTTINGYHIKLLEVLPYPMFRQPLPIDRKIKLSITH